jgi:leader peptidase (prepilin peptidase)/N-methyltransferase
MTILLMVIFGLLGLVTGSFLNVCIDRLPTGKSLAYPPSHCDACQRRLGIMDLIPVVSYLWLRGKCRYCGARISVRVPLVELATGAALVFLLWYFGLSWRFAMVSLYTCLLLVLAVIDLEKGLILNVIVYPAAVVALAIGFFLPEFALYKGILGGAIGLALFLLVALIFRGGMGWGDIKMACLIGLMTGYPSVLAALLAGIIAGGIVALVLMLMGKKSRKDAIPFGPFLTLGSCVALIWGHQLINWYLGMFR